MRSRREAAFARLLGSEQGRRLVQTALVAQVASLYYELLTYDNQLVVLGKNRTLQERAVEIVKLQKLGGRATELAVQQFTAQLLRTRSLEAEADQRIAATENTLNRLLGRYPQPIRRGRALVAQAVPTALSAGLPAAMLLRRPDVSYPQLGSLDNGKHVSSAVSRETLGDLSEWVRLYRRAPVATPDPSASATPDAGPAVPADAPTADPSADALPTVGALRAVGIPALVLSVFGALAAAMAVVAFRHFRRLLR